VTAAPPTRTDVLVVGAGPAGSSAAAWAARKGWDVVLADAAFFPRDKPCGDGLTPRAIAQLDALGLGDWTRSHGTNKGLRAHGFGRTLHLPWPGGSLPDYGSAVPRTELDDKVRTVALDSGSTPMDGARATDVTRDGDRVTGVVFRLTGGALHTVACDRLIVADGVRSPLGRVLGRQWHRETVYGVAGRCYVKSGRSDDEWISSISTPDDNKGRKDAAEQKESAELAGRAEPFEQRDRRRVSAKIRDGMADAVDRGLNRIPDPELAERRRFAVADD